VGDELALAAGEEDPLAAVDGGAPGPVDGEGSAEGSGARWVGAELNSPETPIPTAVDEPVCSPAHGMNEALGPPSRPTAMTTRYAAIAPPAPRPSSRIRRLRRPETSAKTGARCSDWRGAPR
jgi:hypothetical protein